MCFSKVRFRQPKFGHFHKLCKVLFLGHQVSLRKRRLKCLALKIDRMEILFDLYLQTSPSADQQLRKYVCPLHPCHYQFFMLDLSKGT